MRATLSSDTQTQLITRGDSDFQSAPPAPRSVRFRTTAQQQRATFCFRKLFNSAPRAAPEPGSFESTNWLRVPQRINSDTQNLSEFIKCPLIMLTYLQTSEHAPSTSLNQQSGPEGKEAWELLEQQSEPCWNNNTSALSRQYFSFSKEHQIGYVVLGICKTIINAALPGSSLHLLFFSTSSFASSWHFFPYLYKHNKEKAQKKKPFWGCFLMNKEANIVKCTSLWLFSWWLSPFFKSQQLKHDISSFPWAVKGPGDDQKYIQSLIYILTYTLH